MAFNFNGTAGRDLSNEEKSQLTSQFGVDYNKLNGTGEALGNSGYDIFHTGTNWGVRPSALTGAADTGVKPAVTPAPAPPPTAAPTTTPAFNYAAPQAPATPPTGASPIQDQRTSFVSRMLQNPYSMGPQQVSQMKESGKEQAVGLEQQLAKRLSTNAAARGVAGGGNENAQLRKLGENTNSSIITGNRSVDLAKAAQDRTDELNLLGASDTFLNSDLGRQSQIYTNQLAGTGQAQDWQNSQGALALQQELGRGGLNLQGELGRGSLALDQSRLGESGRQFDLAQSLALQQFLENQRQFNRGLGYNYTQLAANGQQNTIGNL